MKKFITIGLALIIIMCAGFVNTVQAQRHLYNRVEFGGGNELFLLLSEMLGHRLLL